MQFPSISSLRTSMQDTQGACHLKQRSVLRSMHAFSPTTLVASTGRSSAQRRSPWHRASRPQTRCPHVGRGRPGWASSRSGRAAPNRHLSTLCLRGVTTKQLMLKIKSRSAGIVSSASCYSSTADLLPSLNQVLLVPLVCVDASGLSTAPSMSTWLTPCSRETVGCRICSPSTWPSCSLNPRQTMTAWPPPGGWFPKLWLVVRIQFSGQRDPQKSTIGAIRKV